MSTASCKTARVAAARPTLRVMLARPGKLDLNLSYAVAGAQWTPAYDYAAARAADRSVDLGYFGVINQTTGEDWNKVKLTLSTARPSLGGGAPALTPWVVDVAVPPPPMPAAARVPRRPRRAKRGRWRARRWPCRNRPSTPRRSRAAARSGDSGNRRGQSGATSASFQIQAPVTLPSDNSTQRVAITTVKLPATLNTNPRRRCARRPS